MNKYISFTGGKPDFNIDDILWNDEATRLALQEVFRAFGDNYIIQGVTGTTSITAGYIMLDSELIRVDAHTKTSTHFAKVTIYDSGGDATFNDGIARQTWQKNRATISASSGSLEYATAERIEDRLSALVTNERILTKIVEIGDWNMDSSVSVGVLHGLTDHKKVRSINVIIRDDSDSVYYDLTQADGSGVVQGNPLGIDSTSVTLQRLSGGSFDSVNFDSTSYNRGWITFQYVE